MKKKFSAFFRLVLVPVFFGAVVMFLFLAVSHFFLFSFKTAVISLIFLVGLTLLVRRVCGLKACGVFAGVICRAGFFQKKASDP